MNSNVNFLNVHIGNMHIMANKSKGLLGIFSAYYKVLFKPSEIVGQKMSIKDAFIFYYKLAIIPFILFLLVGLLSLSNISNNSLINSLTNTILFIETNLIWHNYAYYSCTIAFQGIELVLASGIFYILILYPLLALIYVIIFHAVWKNFLHQIKGTFSATLTATLFGTLVLTIFAWLIPSALYSNYASIGFLISLILFIWNLAVLSIALSEQHNITRQQALGGVFTLDVLAGVVLIGVLLFFSLGIFGGSSVLPPVTCLPQSNYVCNNLNLEVSGTNTNLLRLYGILGQSTGTDWFTANVIFVNSSDYYYNYTAPINYFTPQNITVIPGGLASGEIVNLNVTMPLPPLSAPLGFVCSLGESKNIWVQYQTSIGGTFYYAKMAYFNLIVDN